jgi:hypothetical protein
MPYTKRVDRHHPSCLIFLIDQSASMLDPIAGGAVSKAAAVAEQLNGILYELIQRCSKAHGEPPRPYFAAAVIGYGTEEDGTPNVGSRLSPQLTERSHLVWTTDLALNPLRLEQRERKGPGGDSISFRFPVWIDPFAHGGTPMCTGLNIAGRLARGWIDTYPDSFPPIIVNLTDGESTDGDPREWAERIKGLQTSDGSVLLFNVGITSEVATPVMFPAAQDQVQDRFGRVLFEMSSVLPEFMATAAQRQGFQVEAGARGFGLNADLRSMITFLNIGTSVAHLLR